MGINENYVYKKEVDWSLLNEGLTLPVQNQVIFGLNIGRFLRRGESKSITLYLNGKSYKAKLTNVNYAERHKRIKDTLQIRYTPNSDIANALRTNFYRSYQYISEMRRRRKAGDRSVVHLPEGRKEYLAIYTTEFEDTYILDTILAQDIDALRDAVKNKQERVLEACFNYDVEDNKAGIFETERIAKIRKLNKKIGDNLKLLYNYKCQICGCSIGEQYDSHIAEAHHIDYFVRSLNNDPDNQLIVCPNHHSIIHNVNPIFDRNKLTYIYSNGKMEGLTLNLHL